MRKEKKAAHGGKDDNDRLRHLMDTIESKHKHFQGLKEDTKALDTFFEKCLRAALKGAAGIPSPSDVIHVNFAGQKQLTLRRERFLGPHAKRSLLSVLFDARWQAVLPKDTDDRVYLDIDYEWVKPVLEEYERQEFIAAQGKSCSDVLLTKEDWSCSLFVFDPLFHYPLSAKFMWSLDFRGLACCTKSADDHLSSLSMPMLQVVHKRIAALFGEENVSMVQVREGGWLSEGDKASKKLFFGKVKQDWIGAVFDCSIGKGQVFALSSSRTNQELTNQDDASQEEGASEEEEEGEEEEGVSEGEVQDILDVEMVSILDDTWDIALCDDNDNVTFGNTAICWEDKSLEETSWDLFLAYDITTTSPRISSQDFRFRSDRHNYLKESQDDAKSLKKLKKISAKLDKDIALHEKLLQQKLVEARFVECFAVNNTMTGFLLSPTDATQFQPMHDPRYIKDFVGEGADLIQLIRESYARIAAMGAHLKQRQQSDNIVYFNVGGESVCALRSSILSVLPKSKLAMCVSGEQEGTLDSEGRIIVNFPAPAFSSLLKFIRVAGMLGTLISSKQILLPHHQWAPIVQKMLDFLSIENVSLVV